MIGKTDLKPLDNYILHRFRCQRRDILAVLLKPARRVKVFR